jgi:hypothetical protein
MSVLPDLGLPNTMSEAEYEALPAGVAQRIEVVHGYVIACESRHPSTGRWPGVWRTRSLTTQLCGG